MKAKTNKSTTLDTESDTNKVLPSEKKLKLCYM